MPKVSVIVPIYNVEAYLPACLDSVCAQTLRDIEIVLVDDGSPDGCGAICEAYAARDERIRVIHQENRGLSGARNAGIEAAAGQYLCFIDSDDWIDPDMLEKLYRGVTENDAQICSCDAMIEEDDGTHTTATRQMHDTMRTGLIEYGKVRLDRFMENEYGRRAPVEVCFSMFSRACIDAVGLRFLSLKRVLAEDWPFSLCYYAQVKRGYYLNEPLYHYRMRQDSIMHKPLQPDRLNKWLHFVLEVRQFYKKNGACRQPSWYYAKMVWGYVLRCANRQTPEQIREMLDALDAESLACLRRSLVRLLFGKAGNYYLRKFNMRGRAALYQKLMWLLMLLGKYDKPIRTNLASAQ